MVDRNLVRSRSQAKSLILAGEVAVDGNQVTRPAAHVTPLTSISISDGPRWVSRGAAKLDAALTVFGVDVEGRRAIDVGASTGGFTEVLLTRGATHVVAIDVGTGQLAHSLRNDQRVLSLERTDVREVASEDIGGPAEVVTVDVSFISLTKVIGSLAALLAPDGDLIALVKPQFELGPGRVGKRGIVRDEAQRLEALELVSVALRNTGLEIVATERSPIEGSDGNVEFLLWAKPMTKGKQLESAD